MPDLSSPHRSLPKCPRQTSLDPSSLPTRQTNWSDTPIEGLAVAGLAPDSSRFGTGLLPLPVNVLGSRGPGACALRATELGAALSIVETLV